MRADAVRPPAGNRATPGSGRPVRRLLDWIWHVRGDVALPPGQTPDEAFASLEPLFRERGTSHDRRDNALTFRKKDQAAQDRMSIFDGGTLRIEKGVLRYDLVSRALLFCFLAPFMFLAIAQLTIAIATFEEPSPKVAAEKKAKADAAKRRLASLPMNPIDRALGAPKPELPKKNKKDDVDRKKPTATPAYVFAAIFAVLWVVGRVLEAWLIRRLFERKLSER